MTMHRTTLFSRPEFVLWHNVIHDFLLDTLNIDSEEVKTLSVTSTWFLANNFTQLSLWKEMETTIYCQAIPIINQKPRLATVKPAAEIQRCIVANKLRDLVYNSHIFSLNMEISAPLKVWNILNNKANSNISRTAIPRTYWWLWRW